MFDINTQSAKHNKSRLLLSSAEILEASWSKSLDLDQTAFRNNLIWVDTVCLYAYISQKWKEIFAADDLSRRHFQMHFCLRFKG